MQEFDMMFVKFRVVKGGCTFSASALMFDPDDCDASGELLAKCIDVLSVPIVDLELSTYHCLTAANVQHIARVGASIYKLEWAVPSTMSEPDLIEVYKSFRNLTCLVPSTFRCRLSDKRLLNTIANCPNLTDLCLMSSTVTDATLARVLELCGAKLKKFMLHACTKASILTLEAIVKYCPDLVHLVLHTNAQLLGPLLEFIMIPDHLKKLTKLGLSLPVLSKVRKSDVAFPVRWRKALCLAWYNNGQQAE